MLCNYLRVIRTPLYFPVWLGQLVSNLGDTIDYVALVVSIFKLTGSGLALSTLVFFQIVPLSRSRRWRVSLSIATPGSECS